MMQQEQERRRQQPGTLSEQRRQMPALLHNIKAAINNHPSLLAYSRVFKEEEKKERENRMQSFTCARRAFGQALISDICIAAVDRVQHRSVRK